jgi:hypothetical protein
VGSNGLCVECNEGVFPISVHITILLKGMRSLAVKRQIMDDLKATNMVPNSCDSIPSRCASPPDRLGSMQPEHGHVGGRVHTNMPHLQDTVMQWITVR